MARRRRSRQVDIFNFSFLDILACTIGLLIFILVMVFILQSGSPVADSRAIIERKAQTAAAANIAAERDNRIAESLENQGQYITAAVSPSLIALRNDAKSKRDAAQSDLRSKLNDLHTLERQLEQARIEHERRSSESLKMLETELHNAQDHLAQANERLNRAKAAEPGSQVLLLPRHGGAVVAAMQVLHVDCRSDRVVILTVGDDGKAKESGECPTNALGDFGSPFLQAVRRQQSFPNPHVLLWVRPDGMHTLQKAIDALPSNISHGFEPADSTWKFDEISR